MKAGSGDTPYRFHPGRRLGRSGAGFTLLEMTVVVALLAVLTSIAMPQFAAYLERSRSAQCLANRYHIEQEERTHYLQHQRASLAIDDRFRCPSGGVYVWLISNPVSPDYPRVLCSLHGGSVEPPPGTPAEPPPTGLGSTFGEITTALIDRITRYRQTHGAYPQSLSDLGLNPAQWTQPVNGLLYAYWPQSGAIVVEPAAGYVMTVNNLKGRSLILYPGTKEGELRYLLEDGTWLHHPYQNQNQQVDIGTLKVQKQ